MSSDSYDMPFPEETPSQPDSSDSPQATMGATASAPAAAAADGPSTSTTPKLRRQQTDPNLRSCFICLQTSAETPSSTWVNACTCTLEAHEDCVLHWISEHERESTKSLRCPACKGRIQTVEPHDYFVGAKDRIHRLYSRATPPILMGVVGTCMMAGSSYYGMMSMVVFAGPHKAMSWLGLAKALMGRRYIRVPWYMWHAAWEVSFKFWMLSFVAPALMMHKALPQTSVLAVPLSLMYGSTLAFKNNMPTWPPSPAWALTFMPFVSLSYNNVYHTIFGPLEKRLNKTLRGRGPPVEERPGDAPEAERPAENGGVAPAAEADEEDEGIIAILFRTANILLGLFGDNDREGHMIAELEVRIGRDQEDEMEAEREVQQLQDDLEAIQEIEENLAEILGRDDQEVIIEVADATEVAPEQAAGEGQADQPNEPAQQQEEQQQQGQDDQAEPPPAIRLEAVRLPNGDNPPNNPAPAAAQAAADDRGGSTTLTDIVNGTVSALSFPVVSWGAGEILGYTLPRHWVAKVGRRPIPGLLQERWGRSLVGGCVFVILRDAINLYAKYRRVEVRKHRRVKNVPRRKRSGFTREQ